VTEVRKDDISSIPKLLDLKLEETHKSWGDEVEDAEVEMRNRAAGARDLKGRDGGFPDGRRYEPGRGRMESGRVDDRPTPAKRMKDEPGSYQSQSQRDSAGYTRDRADRARGSRGRGGKPDTYRSGVTRGGRSATTDFRYPPMRDGVVSEYQPGRGEKRGTLTFERSDLHPERQTSFEGKHGGQFRSGDYGSRQGREDRNRDGRPKDRESSTKKDSRVNNTSKLSEAQSVPETVSGAFGSSSDLEPAKTNAWSQPLHGSKQSSELAGADKVPDVGQWNADGQTPFDSTSGQQESGVDKDLARKVGDHDALETGSRSVENQGDDKESRKQTGSRAEGPCHEYRGERGRRPSRRGRRQNWPEQATEFNDSVPQYGRRSQPRTNKDRSSRVVDDVGKDPDGTTSREERNQNDRRRTVRYGSGGRGFYQSGHGEYSSRSRGRGAYRLTCIGIFLPKYCQKSNIYFIKPCAYHRGTTSSC